VDGKQLKITKYRKVLNTAFIRMELVQQSNYISPQSLITDSLVKLLGSGLEPRRCWVRITAGTQAILTEAFMVFLTLSRKMFG
jgi:hypothetical protein